MTGSPLPQHSGAALTRGHLVNLAASWGRYIVKQLSKTEKASLLDYAPAYFEYLLGRHADTCLAKILGVFQVCLPASAHANVLEGVPGHSALPNCATFAVKV